LLAIDRTTMKSNRLLLSIAAAVLLVTGCGASDAPVQQTDALVDIGAGLNGPAGLRATVYTKGLTSVSALAFDSIYRLWITTADFEDEGRDALYVATEVGATPTKVVSALHTPMGLLWYQDSLYVASASGVDVYAGFDGAQFVKHERIIELPANVGKPGNIVLAPDGRMRMGISAPCDSCVPASEYSAAIVSFKPDGTDIAVFASGIRAPVGLMYYPQTNDLFVTMNQRDDLDPQTPGDWLSVVHQGDAWGFPACYGQDGTACTGVPQPIAALDAHAAVSGVAIVTGQLGSTLGTSAVVAEWATGKVLRVALSRDGTSYTGTVHPFLTGMKNPVPVILGSRSEVLIGDWSTGTVYRIAKA
jgi:glucose/arabinose dehydrogenase